MNELDNQAVIEDLKDELAQEQRYLDDVLSKSPIVMSEVFYRQSELLFIEMRLSFREFNTIPRGREVLQKRLEAKSHDMRQVGL